MIPWIPQTGGEDIGIGVWSPEGTAARAHAIILAVLFRKIRSRRKAMGILFDFKPFLHTRIFFLTPNI